MNTAFEQSAAIGFIYNANSIGGVTLKLVLRIKRGNLLIKTVVGLTGLYFISSKATLIKVRLCIQALTCDMHLWALEWTVKVVHLQHF